MYDCHVHSSFSGDSNMDGQEALEAAKEMGLLGIAFTDHLDIDYPNYDDVFLIDFDEYSNYFDLLKLNNKDKIKVFKGIEVGLQPHVIEETHEVIKKYDFDFVIASVHIVDKLDMHNGDFCENKTRFQAYSRYFEAVLEALELYNDYDVLGHLDLVRRYGRYDDKSIKYSDFSDYIDPILIKLISNGKGIEINSSGFRYGLNSTMPDINILKRYKQLGGEIVCT
ncbi:MAG: histidinol-phosphatase HisJ family protein, partial [Clostridiaceae bacterium]|nr:histidinol-phosphatase HisJ family protein [Clostridiaceae bacterium]